MSGTRQILLAHASSDNTSALAELFLGFEAPNSRNCRLWVVADRSQSEQCLRRTAECRSGFLSPGIKPLGQAAESVVAGLPRLIRPLTGVQQSRLIERLLQADSKDGKFFLLRNAAQTPGGLTFVASAFRQFAHANLSTAAIEDLADSQREQRAIELARAYARYTQLLAKHELADRETRLRLACEYLESDEHPNAAPDTLVVSGIDSPTPLEMRFLSALLARAKQGAVAITIANNLGSPSGSLPTPWLGPQRFLQQLQQQWPNAELKTLKGQHAADDPRRAAIERLFLGVPERLSHSLTAGDPRLRVSEATNAQAEVESAVRHAKRLLVQGTPAGQIVIASRQLSEQGPRLLEASAKYGIPLAVEGSTSLATSVAARGAALLLRLASGDWRHADLLNLVTLPQFELFDQTIEAPSQWAFCRQLGFARRRAAIEWLLRDLLCPRGHDSLLRQVTWHADRFTERQSSAEEDDSLDRRRDRLGFAATLALGSLTTLSAACKSFMEAATPLEWFDRLRKALADLKYRSEPEQAREDDAALASLEESFAGLTKLNAWLGKQDQEIELAEVDNLVRGWLPRVSLDLPWQSEGRVLALSAETAAGMAPEHLLVIGLGEQSFPRTESDTLLPSDAQTRQSHSDEMLLFNKLLGAARTSTTFSYTAVDDKAQKLNPSSYLSELQQLFAPNALNIEQDYASTMCAAELREQAVELLLGADTSGMSRLLGSQDLVESGRALGASLIAINQRARGDNFGPYEGMLDGQSAQEFTAERFGPNHLWSASQLEDFATCPFKFYLRHVLKIAPLESLLLEVDYRRRGTLLHDAMARFHLHVNQLLPEGQATSSIDASAFSAAFKLAIEDACDAIASAPHERAVAAVEAMQATAWGEQYRRQHEDYDSKTANFDEPLRPAHFEARFGPKVSASDAPQDPLSTPEPFAFRAGDEKVLLTGQVDRIDVGRVNGRVVFNVIDYKTSKSMTIRQEEIESGRLLQLVLYTIAVGDHLLAAQDAAPWQAGYWLVQEKGFKVGKVAQPGERAEGQVVQGESWQDLVAKVRDTVGGIVRNVRAAQFPMLNVDDDCGGRCEYRTVCRVAQTRSLQKCLPESGASE